nr:hypothetical protein Iba_chr13aCG0940 [Ipomoea batatas]
MSSRHHCLLSMAETTGGIDGWTKQNEQRRGILTYGNGHGPIPKISLPLGWSIIILSPVIIRIIFARPFPLRWGLNFPTSIIVIIILLSFNLIFLTIFLRLKITGIFLILRRSTWPDKIQVKKVTSEDINTDEVANRPKSTDLKTSSSDLTQLKA